METLHWGMNNTCEALAHYTHGCATVFFIIWSFRLWGKRKESRLIMLLFMNMAYLAFCNLKDIIFLFDDLWYDSYLTGISVTIDLIYIPLMSAFFIEAVSPGLMTTRRCLSIVFPQSVWVPVYLLFPDEYVFYGALGLSYLLGVIAMIIVCIQSYRHDKFIRQNYSYTESINVKWILGGASAVFICMTIYMFAFSEETWLGNAVYYLISVVAWAYLYFSAISHQVLNFPLPMFWEYGKEKNEEFHQEEDTEQYKDTIAEGLADCMDQKRMYLNPKLTLNDVASAIGTNRTYLSSYLNNVLEMSFYDYVNSYRIREACNILKQTKDRVVLHDVADASGFNSLSTFNRSFSKYVGMTPSEYLKKHNKSQS